MIRPWARALVTLGSIGTIAACAELQGLDGYEKVDCLDDCADANVIIDPLPDVSVPDANVEDVKPTCPPCTNGTVCDPTSLKCVECLPGTLACAVGKFCDPDPTAGFKCVQGCSTVNDCYAAFDAGLLDAGKSEGGASDAGDAGDAGANPLGAYACCNNRCTDTANSASHCGTCGNACGTGAACCGGACTDTVQNTNACGACGAKCSGTNISTVACTIGKCSGACNIGFDDCNNDKLADGCESDIYTNPTKCGACNKSCSSNHVPSPTCGAGTCNGTCENGWADCNNNKLADGCEIQPATDPDHCGGCPNVCSNNNMATRTCAGSVCNGNCNAGYRDCNSNKLSDGCEINSNTDPNNCGNCGQVCSNNNMATRTCAAGACNGTCTGTFRDCNSNKLSDGCEIDIATNADNCGLCGRVCSNNHMASRTCGGSLCNGTCATGWQDCNTNKQTDGCEARTGIDTNHCTACNTACPANAADYSGVTGRNCVASTCTAGYGQTFPPITFIDACAQAGVTPTVFGNPDDAATASLPLPINFKFYGNTVANYWYSTNGALGFGTPSAALGFACMPDPSNPGPVIVGYGDDLYTRTVNTGAGVPTNTGVCAATIGAVVGTRKHVVTWKDSTYCCSPGDTNHLTFSIILDEATNEVSVVYQTVTGFESNNAAIGLQSATAVVGMTPAVQLGTTYSCSSGYRTVAAGNAILFKP